MASAVDEVSAILGLSQGSDSVPDDLKSPEQHQASMFAARQQLQAKQKGDSSSFTTTGTSSGTKKVAAIKPQFKPLSKKQSSFVTPYIKRDETIKEASPKLSPQKKPMAKQLDKLRESSPGDPGRQLPTVSSRYHCPSLKRSRGRHNDESIVSDEEVQKAKMIKKTFTSPERMNVKSPKSSPKPSPKNSPKLSPKICSPKARSGSGSPNHSPILFHSQNDDKEKEGDVKHQISNIETQEVHVSSNEVTNDSQIDILESDPSCYKSENNTENAEKSTKSISSSAHSSLIPAPDETKDIPDDDTNNGPKNSQTRSSQMNDSNKAETVSNADIDYRSDQHASEAITPCPKSDKLKDISYEDTNASLKSSQTNSSPSYNSHKMITKLELSACEADTACPESSNSTPLSPESKCPKETPDSQSSQLSTADIVKSALDSLHSDQRVHVESYEGHCSVEVDVEHCLDRNQGFETEGTVQEIKHDVENVADCEEECVIEDLLTPLEESLSLPSSSEGLVVDKDELKKGKKKEKKSKSKKKITTSLNAPDEADRQKVNDFFSNKFGMSFSTPKGADRPKPLLKFARKDESDADYSTVQSPGKFKSTFRALGNDKEDEEDGKKVKEEVKAEKKKKSVEEKKPVRKAEPIQKQSGKVEQKTKRKIERSPKRPKKEELKKRISMSTSESPSSSSSNSDESDSDSCMKRSRQTATKPAVKQTNRPRGRPAAEQKKLPAPPKASKDQKLKLKEENMKETVKRKRKKVYSSSDSSESEDEFTLSCANSDNQADDFWVQCERCEKWRCLKDNSDPNLLPEDWVCNLNPDKRYNNCNAPQEPWSEFEPGSGLEYVYGTYSLGSLVWGKMQGYPWWPGMIDNDPLTRTYYYKHANSQNPDKYHVTFFGIQATRAWIGKKYIKVYNPDDKEDQIKYDQRKSGKGVREAIAMANQAFHLELNDRKKIYGFKEQCKSVEDVPTTSSKAKAVKENKVVKKTVSAVKKHSYISRLYEKAVLKLSQESQSTHIHTLKSQSTKIDISDSGAPKRRGRPRKTSITTDKSFKRKKTAKRSSDEQSYIPTPSRLNSLDVIENIENEINQVLRDCSPSPTNFNH